MEVNATANAVNGPPRTTQSSIRSFFQPRPPTYTAPPVALNPQTPAQKPPASTQSASDSPSKTASNTLPSLPPRASISSIEEQHIQPLRRINSLLLPIAYPDSFYHKILSPANFSRILLWTETTVSSATPTVIGGIVCRLDASLTNPSASDIYIQSLALLSPYRGQGLATTLLNTIISTAVSQSSDKIESLYAHVWTENTEALEWYAARGFKREEAVIHGYYRRLKPDTAWILRRRLSPSDHLKHASAAPRNTSPSPAAINPPTLSSGPTSPIKSPSRPSLAHTSSFQDRRPDREWNDLPSDLGLLKPPSATSSRSSSTSRSIGGKKKRQYPAAAYGA